ncbi:TIR domain-containing protein [Leclercia adecarboxylata]|uniref:TIR domain-containing protein n=1 Tax=Leclercia adecarboxylata TaxID=83655 RepID=UPI00194E3DB9|nr:TIR domain-containing protein [Leclercia adecarboxylata]MBM6635068.1 TIR domain-containing protein [Leclercia adecarboxylata]
MEENNIKVFISYSWDNEEHRLWVKKLADELERETLLHVIWDGYDLDSFIDKNLYMEKAVADSDFILNVCTLNYKNKANDRLGGVGIETYLSVNEHWENLQKKKKTKSLVVLKENDATPTYLKGHFHLDFTDDRKFLANVHNLKKQLTGESLFKRPEKKKRNEQLIELTKTGDLISLFYKNKSLIADKTDFSKDNRIKYEIWEIKDFIGISSYIVSFHPNININQTIKNLLEKIKELGLGVKSKYLVLSHGNIKDFTSMTSGYQMVNKRYDDFIWDSCVDASLKHFPIPETIDFYTNQELMDMNKDVYRNAISHLVDINKNKENGNSVNLIIGSGGIGKTSLCQSLANKLANNGKVVVYISSEDIKNHINENNGLYGSVDSLYDFYLMEAKYLEISNIFDKKTFDACILSGKIIVIIDGLDEFTSIFSEQFDLNLFLSSISAFNAELGDSYFILTSREDVTLSDSYLESLNINKCTLLGFKTDNCVAYLNQRFSKYKSANRIVNLITSKIENSSLYEDHRVIPFFVDVISTMYEDNLSEDESSELHFELVESNTSYPSLNKLNDHLIYSIFKREKRRHNFNETPESMIRTFIDLCSDQHDNWKISDFCEIISLNYDRDVELYINLLKKNPLLKVNADNIALRYGFLKSYFTTLDLFYYFTVKPLNATFWRILSRIGDDSYEMKSIIEFVANTDYVERIKSMIIELKSTINENDIHYDKERNEKLITLEKLNLIINKINISSPSTFCAIMMDIYSNEGLINKMFINGDVGNLDFSNTTIRYSHFRNYPKFLNSNFQNSKFEYCKFSKCHNEYIKNSNILNADFDKNSCEMGDIEHSISNFSQQSEVSEERIKQDLVKYLGSFFRAGRFRDNNTAHITFSKNVSKLRENNFNKVLRQGFLVVFTTKNVDTFYEIAKEYKPSVRKFIMDDLMDAKIKDIINWLKED